MQVASAVARKAQDGSKSMKRNAQLLLAATQRRSLSSSVTMNDKLWLKSLVVDRMTNDKLWGKMKTEWVSKLDDIQHLCSGDSIEPEDAKLALDLIMRLTESGSSERYVGLMRMLDSYVDQNCLDAAWMFYKRIVKEDRKLDTVMSDKLTIQLIKVCRFSEFFDVVAAHGVTPLALHSAAQPLFMSGMIDRFSKMFAEFLATSTHALPELSTPSPPVVARIINEIVIARFRRNQSYSPLSKFEVSAMNRILESINKYHANYSEQQGLSETDFNMALTTTHRALQRLYDVEDYIYASAPPPNSMHIQESIESSTSPAFNHNKRPKHRFARPVGLTGRIWRSPLFYQSNRFGYLTEDRIEGENKKGRKDVSLYPKDLTHELTRYEHPNFPLHALYSSTLFPGDLEMEMKEFQAFCRSDSRMLDAFLADDKIDNNQLEYMSAEDGAAAGHLSTDSKYAFEEDEEDEDNDDDDDEDDEFYPIEDGEEEDDDNDDDDYHLNNNYDGDSEEDDSKLSSSNRQFKTIEIRFVDPAGSSQECIDGDGDDEGEEEFVVFDAVFEHEMFELGNNNDNGPSFQFTDLTSALSKMYSSLELDYSDAFFASSFQHIHEPTLLNHQINSSDNNRENDRSSSSSKKNTKK